MIFLLLLLQILDSPIQAAPEEHAYRWIRGQDADQIHLYDFKQQIGTWVFSERAYHPYNAATESWGYPKPMPQGAPQPPAKLAMILYSGC